MNAADYPVSSYDLHAHTCWSFDAIEDPEAYFRRATELGITCIAVTDHFHLDSLPEVTEIATRYPEIRAIPAIETTVATSIGPVDILCYGFRQPFSADLQQIVARYHTWQRETGAATWKGMQALGFDFSESQFDEILTSYRPPRVLAVQGHTLLKYHYLRQYFLDRGFISEFAEYDDLLARAAAAASSPPYPGVDEVTPVMKASGAVVALAHPLYYFNRDDERRMDQLRVECALDGIECAHRRSIPPELMPVYRKYCVKHGLFSVAGSDLHGEPGELEGYGRHGGKEEWLAEFLDRV